MDRLCPMKNKMKGKQFKVKYLLLSKVMLITSFHPIINFLYYKCILWGNLKLAVKHVFLTVFIFQIRKNRLTIDHISRIQQLLDEKWECSNISYLRTLKKVARMEGSKCAFKF